jgi:hypothetical protein
MLDSIATVALCVSSVRGYRAAKRKMVLGSRVVLHAANIPKRGDHIAQCIVKGCEAEAHGVGDLIVAQVHTDPHGMVALGLTFTTDWWLGHCRQIGVFRKQLCDACAPVFRVDFIPGPKQTSRLAIQTTKQPVHTYGQADGRAR